MIKRPNSWYWQPLRSHSLIMLLVARAFGRSVCVVLLSVARQISHTSTHSRKTQYTHAPAQTHDAMSIGKILGIRIWHKHERRPQMNEET